MRVFLFGALITVPVFFVQIGLTLLMEKFQIPPFIYDFLYWFVIIAFTEEVFKYLVLRYCVINNSEFDEALDTMLYMIIAALGFAALENTLYLFTPAENMKFSEVLNRTLIISFVRFIGATFLHTLCSGLFGYFLAISFKETKNRIKIALIGLFSASLLHGLYDFSIMTFEPPFQLSVPAMVLVGLAIFMIWAFNRIKKVKNICKIELSET